MADISLDELIRKRGTATKGRLSVRPGIGGVRSRVGIQHSLLSQPARTATFQQRFDARQKIGLSDARLKLGVKDAREKLLQKDARFRIKGKVQDAREMLNSRKQQNTVPQKPRQVADAREDQLEEEIPCYIHKPAHWDCDPRSETHQNYSGSTAKGHGATSCPSCWNEDQCCQ